MQIIFTSWMDLVSILLGTKVTFSKFQSIQHLHFHISSSKGILGAIYAKKGDAAELEKLTQLFMNPAEYSSEHWLIFGYHYYVMKKYDKASYFAHKACYLNPRNIEACLLKGTTNSNWI